MATDYYKDKLAPISVGKEREPGEEGAGVALVNPIAAFFKNIAAAQVKNHTPSTLTVSEPKEQTFSFDRNTVVPLVYGRRLVTGIPIPVGVVGDKIYVAYIFCEGEIESYESFLIDGQAVANFSGLYSFTEYTGTLTQTYDSDLHTADANWVEPLTGTAYVVAEFTVDDNFNSIPRLQAVIEGKKCYDHRTDTTIYSTNPIVCLIDNKMSTRYGGSVASAKIDWTTADAAADDCEEQVNSENRYDLNYLISNPTSLDNVQEFILNHCNGEQLFSEGKYYFHVHKARASVATFTQDEVWGVKLSRPRNRDLFNRARASYLHTDDWREDEYTLETDDLIAGNEIASEGHFDFTGCTSLSQVHRLCVFQLNSRISDLQISFKTYNTQGVERYDRIQFTHDVFSLTDQDFYVLSVNGDTITATEYSADLFSDATITQPSIPEATLPLPTAVPDEVTDLAVTEATQEAQDGHTTAVLEVSWTASVFPWIKHYEIWTYKTGGAYQLYGITRDTSCTIPTTSELTTHYVKIITVSKWDVKSTGASSDETLTTTADRLLNHLQGVNEFQGVAFPSAVGSPNNIDCYVTTGASGGWYKIAEVTFDRQYGAFSWDGLFSWGESEGRYKSQSRVTFGCASGASPYNVSAPYFRYSGDDLTARLKINYTDNVITCYAYLAAYDSCLFHGAWAVNLDSAANSWIKTYQVEKDSVSAPTGTDVTPTANYDIGADITNDNTADDADNYTGAAIDVSYTDAKCEDAAADETGENTADDTDHANDTDTDSGHTLDIKGDLRIMNGKDIEFYTGDGSGFVGGILATTGAISINATTGAKVVLSGSGGIQFSNDVVSYGDIIPSGTCTLGDSSNYWSNLHASSATITNPTIGTSDSKFTLHWIDGTEITLDCWIT